jgi:diguanylate cyclase (GGDEF)-like protein
MARTSRSRRTDAGRQHELARRFERALEAGSSHDAGVVVAEAFGADLSVASVQSNVIAPAMREIGDLWECGELTVGDEHLATAISQEVLGRMFMHALQSPPRSRERVMLAAAQGEHHVLGLRMAADVLEGAGFDVLYLGADVPLEALLDSCRTHTPAVLGLTVSIPQNLPAFIRTLRAVSALEEPPAIFAGGLAVAAAIEQGLAIASVQSTEFLIEAVEALLAAPRRTEIVSAQLAARFDSGAGEHAFDTPATETNADAFAATALSGAEGTRDSARHAYAMEQLAYRDPLTGLSNRRAYDDRFTELAEGTSPDAMVVTIDIDRFKTINDRYGHAGGDAALVAVAKVLQRRSRPDDLVARYGGDEFAILLPGATVAEATQIGERIRATVQSEVDEPPVTVSIGVARALATARRTALAVDNALYDAKEKGRNQVVVST